MLLLLKNLDSRHSWIPFPSECFCCLYIVLFCWSYLFQLWELVTLGTLFPLKWYSDIPLLKGSFLKKSLSEKCSTSDRLYTSLFLCCELKNKELFFPIKKLLLSIRHFLLQSVWLKCPLTIAPLNCNIIHNMKTLY